MSGFIIPLAFLLDLLRGDPEEQFHPVRLIGKAITAQEEFYRSRLTNLRVAGVLLWIITVVGTLTVCNIAVGIAGFIHPLVGIIVQVIMVYYALSVKSLGDEALLVKGELDEGQLDAARSQLSRLVGRDTEKLSEQEISRATVETVAENFVDGVVSPLFFAALGGGPLALAFKAVNTLDSMVGYKNEKYKEFGYFSAKMDDAANFIPARLSIPIVTASAFVLGLSYLSAWRVGLRDRLRHPSPNSAHGEAVFAGALGIELGGDSTYGGVPSSKPKIGDSTKPLAREDIALAVRLMRVSSLIGAIAFALISGLK